MFLKIIYFTCVFFIECISFYKVALIIWMFIINNALVLFLLAILISDELLIVFFNCSLVLFYFVDISSLSIVSQNNYSF